MGRICVYIGILLALAAQGCGEIPSQAATAEGPAGEEAAYSVAPFDAALKAYTDEQGMVDYEGLKADPREMNRYLSMVASLDRSTYDQWEDSGKIAFWINVYNAYTLKAIIDHYPIEASFLKSFVYPENSIRQISGVWDELEWEVMGRALTLNEMEHEVLRKQFPQEPRIHAALVCAAMGCPPLRREAYTGERLDDQLDDQMRRFLNHPEKFRIDYENDVVYLSKIFDWYGADFIPTNGTDAPFEDHSPAERAVLNAALQYVDDEAKRFLNNSGFTIKYLEYDWSLNEQT